MKKIILPASKPKVLGLRERSIFVRIRWEDREIPEKVYWATSQYDAEKFIEAWAREVNSPMFVEFQGLESKQGTKDVLGRILA